LLIWNKSILWCTVRKISKNKHKLIKMPLSAICKFNLIVFWKGMHLKSLWTILEFAEHIWNWRTLCTFGHVNSNSRTHSIYCYSMK
jgi:hypothetical protein